MKMVDLIIKKAIKEYSTPFYLYEKDCIIDHANKLKSVLFENTDICFSMKSNPLIGILKLFVEIGFGIEAASKGELVKALKSGCNASDIIFSSPGKERKEIEFAVENNIFCINIENFTEIKIIEDSAAAQNKKVNVGIRINPGVKSKGKISMSGNTQFGFEINSIEKAIEEIKKSGHLNLIGFQVYMGTQILDAEEIVSNTENIICYSLQLSKDYGINLEYINLGGGFGIPYFPNEHDLDLSALKSGMQAIYEKYPEIHNIKRIVFESGRFLMAEAGVFVTQVLYKKQMGDINYLICDGGSNYHASSAFLGRFVRNNFPMHTISDSNEEEKVTVVGNLCTPTDVIGQNVTMKKAEENDYVVIEKSGAYGLTYSPFGFLGHELPLELLYDNEFGYNVLKDKEGNEFY